MEPEEIQDFTWDDLIVDIVLNIQYLDGLISYQQLIEEKKKRKNEE